MIHILNPTTNNSSNYVKQLPFSIPNEKELKIVNELVSKIMNSFEEEAIVDVAQKELNVIFEKKYLKLLA